MKKNEVEKPAGQGALWAVVVMTFLFTCLLMVLTDNRLDKLECASGLVTKDCEDYQHSVDVAAPITGGCQHCCEVTNIRLRDCQQSLRDDEQRIVQYDGEVFEARKAVNECKFSQDQSLQNCADENSKLRDALSESQKQSDLKEYECMLNSLKGNSLVESCTVSSCVHVAVGGIWCSRPSYCIENNININIERNTKISVTLSNQSEPSCLGSDCVR